MTPHEVIKNNIEKFKHLKDCDKEDVGYHCDDCGNAVKDYLKSSYLSLLLSVKEMVESSKVIDITQDGLQIGDASAYNQALSDLQSLFDEEINKAKEL